EYVRPTWQKRPRPQIVSADGNGASPKSWGATIPGRPAPLNGGTPSNGGLPALDRTAKLFIGGKQARPDGNYSRNVFGPDEQTIGQVADGNRKDIRNAVEAAHSASKWASQTGHNRAQILYYVAENLNARATEFAQRIVAMTGRTLDSAKTEVELAVERLFTYAAWADKFGGSIQETLMRGLTIAVNEQIGVIGIACPDEYPLLAFIALLAPAVARGNTIVIIPSERFPLSATDFYQILETSDVPAGVVNIVTGSRDHLSKTLAEHDDVDAMWYFGTAEGSQQVEAASATNMKRTWVDYGEARDWTDTHQGAGEEFLHESIQVKNIWVPTGE
ncbi:MAG: aldehyde dehydrogenase, partial [Burkholderiales bacterium]|nr:aldehyde dehydrogenase [Anaerolineae bacterium]